MVRLPQVSSSRFFKSKGAFALLFFCLVTIVLPNHEALSKNEDSENPSDFQVEKGPEPTTHVGCEDRYAREVKICQTLTCYARIFNRLSRCQKVVQVMKIRSKDKRKLYVDGDLKVMEKEELTKRHQTEKMRTKNKKAAGDVASSF